MCGPTSFETLTGVRVQADPLSAARHPAMQDLVAGRIDLSGLEASSSLPYVQAGKIKGLRRVDPGARWPGGAGTSRHSTNRALPGLRDCRTGPGLWVKKGTPAEIRGETERPSSSKTMGRSRDHQTPHRSRPTNPARADQQTPQALGRPETVPAIEKWWPIIKARKHQGGLSVNRSSCGKTRRKLWRIRSGPAYPTARQTCRRRRKRWFSLGWPSLRWLPNRTRTCQ